MRKKKVGWVEKDWRREVERCEIKLELHEEVKVKGGREEYLAAAGVKSVTVKAQIRGARGVSDMEVDRGPVAENR